MATGTLLFLRNYTLNRLGCLINQPWPPAAVTSDPVAMQRCLVVPCPRCCGRAAITTKGPSATNYSSKREVEKSSPTSVGLLVMICLWQWPCRAGGGLFTEPGICQTVTGAGTRRAPSRPTRAERGRAGRFTAPILTCRHVRRLSSSSSPAAPSEAGVESSRRHRRVPRLSLGRRRRERTGPAAPAAPGPLSPAPPPPRSPAAPALRPRRRPPPLREEGEASEETRGTKGRDQKKA